jgi:hypothetical protein
VTADHAVTNQPTRPSSIHEPDASRIPNRATTVTRLAINHLRSARYQRETYVGPWLPEPLVTELAPDPSEHVELAESRFVFSRVQHFVPAERTMRPAQINHVRDGRIRTIYAVGNPDKLHGLVEAE